MKTYQVWLILEDTENDDGPIEQIETYQFAVAKTEENGRLAFSWGQDVLEAIKPHLNLIKAED